jgi:hypothetical protein
LLHCKSLAGVVTIGAFLLPGFNHLAHADFFQTRNQSPFTLFQGQPLPLSAERVGDSWQIQQSLDIANTLNLQSDAQQSLFADFESYNFNTRLTRSLDDNWSLVLDIPIIRRGGGMFDNAIDNWHKAFGLPRADRPNVANNQFAINYSQNGVTLVQLSQASTELGDISASLGYHLQQSSDVRLAIWLSAELPAGNSKQLTGNEQTDFSFTLAAGLTPSPAWQLDLNLGVVIPGGDLIAASPTADSVLYSYLAAGWQLLDWLQLRLQLESHQSYFENDSLALMGKANVLVFGGVIRIDRCNQLDIGVSEDIDVGASPDISLLVSWRYRGASC